MTVSDLRVLEHENQTSKTKLIFVTGAFLVSLAAFVCQTEFTSLAYQLHFKEPMVMLWVTHGSWWLLWPLQVLLIATFRTLGKWKNQTKTIKLRRSSVNELQYQRLNSNSQLLENGDAVEEEIPVQPIDYYKYWKKCIVKQFHNIYHTAVLIYEANINGDTSTSNLNQLISKNVKLSETSSVGDCISSFVNTPAIRNIIGKGLYITIVLTAAGATWYGAMALTYASDVTAIYNCSAFTAYAFAIPMLNDSFTWMKVSSVFIAVTGVFLVAYSGSDQPVDAQYPYRLWGNLIILIGAVLYGYYECLYKLHTCIPAHLSKIITPRRQATFANFVMGIFGFFTSIIILVGILFLQLTGIHKFNFFDYGENTKQIWLYIGACIVSNLTFSASFLCLMALTGPVLSSVSSLLTIFLIGIVEWYVFGNKLGFQQLLGDGFIVVGFVLLTFASWKEISEGQEDSDEVDAVSTYSFAVSTNE